jgi:hypothetical protein
MGNRGPKKGHKGHRQVMLDPTDIRHLKPTQCACGNREFPETAPYYTHQVIELPEIKMEVTHLVLHKAQCPCCGKLNKALIPEEHRCGYGPRLTAMIGEMAGNQGESRSLIQSFCLSVLGFSISLGAIQKVIDRVAKAIEPHYEQIAQQARRAQVNHVDETSCNRSQGVGRSSERLACLPRCGAGRAETLWLSWTSSCPACRGIAPESFSARATREGARRLPAALRLAQAGPPVRSPLENRAL